MKDSWEGKIYESSQQWMSEGKKIFGTDNPYKWAWKCPACGRKQTMSEFKSLENADPNDAYQECIGRYFNGRKGPYKCDWAAYGLFRGPSIVKENGKEIAVFDFWDNECTKHPK